MASPAAIPPEPLTVEFRILAILDLVPLILLLVTDEASRESELLPEEMVDVGLGSWLILWCLKFQFIAQAHIILISVLGSKLLCLKNKKDGVTTLFNLQIISWRRCIDYTFINSIHLNTSLSLVNQIITISCRLVLTTFYHFIKFYHIEENEFQKITWGMFMFKRLLTGQM